MRPAFLALDGGGSKIDAALVGRDGRVLGAARSTVSRGAGPDGLGHQGRVDDLAPVIERVCADAGLDPASVPLAPLGVYCLAGADLPADDRLIAKALAKRGWTTEDVVLNDTFAVLRAGSDRKWGVAVVCGYGMNCSGVAPDGRTVRFPAVGSISGDWGGGLDIGELALWHAFRARDGRGRSTALANLVPEYFGMKHPRQVMEAIHFGRLRREKVGELPPIVFRSAADGDAVARSIVDRQADEVVVMAGATLRRLRLTKQEVDVVLGGGIFRSGDEVFFERIERGLKAVAAAVRIIVLGTPPVVGAALIGLDRVDAGRSAEGRIRAGLTYERLNAGSVGGGGTA